MVAFSQFWSDNARQKVTYLGVGIAIVLLVGVRSLVRDPGEK